MAINSTNSNYVNISNLPQTQEAVNTDLMILQTENGTQTITFDNLNVVKTDAVGNATIIGGVTGTGAQFSTLSALNYVTSSQYYANSIPGYTALNGFYNRFTLNSGIVTSATYVGRANDDYIYLTQTFIPTLTAEQNTIYTRTIDKVGLALANPNSEGVTITIGSFFTDYPFIGAANIKPWHFTIALDNKLSACPYIPPGSIANNGTGGLRFDVVFPARNVPSINVYARVLITYTVNNGTYNFGSQ
jgi:hypothetical protein